MEFEEHRIFFKQQQLVPWQSLWAQARQPGLSPDSHVGTTENFQASHVVLTWYFLETQKCSVGSKAHFIICKTHRMRPSVCLTHSPFSGAWYNLLLPPWIL